MSKITYFNPEKKCYKLKNDVENLNEYFDSNFIASKFEVNFEPNDDNNIDLINECKKKTLDNKENYFFVSNFNHLIKDNKQVFEYDCLIPKSNNRNFKSIQDLLEPFNRIINDLFKKPSSNLYRHDVEVTQNIDMLDLKKKKRELENCFEITGNNIKDKTYFSKNNNFILYKSRLINDNDTMKFLEGVNTFSSYKNKYKELFESKNINNILEQVKITFKHFICEPTRLNEDKLNSQIFNLKDEYDKIFSELDSISNDISNISVLTKEGTLLLQEMQYKVNSYKKKLESLINSDGANNGKYQDTKLKKTIVSYEVIILIIIIICFGYLFKKNRI